MRAIKNYKNLALKGGGVLGIAYTGALLELEKRGIIKGIERISANSAGSAVGTLIALKYTAQEIYEISYKTDFKKFEDGRFKDKVNAGIKYGINPGDALLEWITEKIVRKGFKQKATFADFHKAGMLDLNIFATDLNFGNLDQFCYAKTPNVPVAYAVRASSSIPFFFEAFKFPNNNPNDHIYVDGGLVINYPLSCFDIDSENQETLGLFVGDLYGKNVNNNLDFGHPIQYAKALGNALLNSQNINLTFDKEDIARTIQIDSCGVSATNFSLTLEEQIKLFEAGRRATIKYFS